MTILAFKSAEDLDSYSSGAQIDPSKPGCGDVAQVQLALQQQGYYSGPLDGVSNDGMVSAMADFLSDKGLPQTASNQEFCQALRNAQMEMASRARSELNSRVLGVNPVLLGLGFLGAIGAFFAYRGKMSRNGGRSRRTSVFWFSRRVEKGDKRGKKHAKMEQGEMVRKLKSMGVRAEAKVSSGKRGTVFKVKSGPLGRKSAAVKRALAAIQRKHFR